MPSKKDKNQKVWRKNNEYVLARVPGIYSRKKSRQGMLEFKIKFILINDKKNIFVSYLNKGWLRPAKTDVWFLEIKCGKNKNKNLVGSFNHQWIVDDIIKKHYKHTIKHSLLM